jgi:plasmid stability protein
MASVLVKNVPQQLHSRLKHRAAEHRRSLSSEMIVLLEEALAPSAGPPTLADIDSLRIHGNVPLTQELLDAAREQGRP